MTDLIMTDYIMIGVMMPLIIILRQSFAVDFWTHHTASHHPDEFS
jgi:hypothetical protein